MSDVTYDVRDCARCRGSHTDVEYEPLIYGVDIEDDLGPMTHWAPCPTNGQPILMRMVPEDTPDPSRPLIAKEGENGTPT